MAKRVSLIGISEQTGVSLNVVRQCAEQVQFLATPTALISPEVTWKITNQMREAGHTHLEPLGTRPAPETPKEPDVPVTDGTSVLPITSAVPLKKETRGKSDRKQKPKAPKTRDKSLERGQDPRRAQSVPPKHRIHPAAGAVRGIPKLETPGDQIVRNIAIMHNVPVADVIALAKEFGIPVTRDSKLPRSTAEKIFARFNPDIGRPEVDSVHLEAARAETRASIIRRSESDWEKLGFSNEDKRKWIDAGIPDDKAHIAAMCRETMRYHKANLAITPAALSLTLSSGKTTLETLLGGMNCVRLLSRIASQKRLNLSGLPQELLPLCTSVTPMGEDQAKAVADKMNTVPVAAKTVPFLAESVSKIAKLRLPDLQERVDFKKQIDVYLEQGFASPLISSYGRTHGAFFKDQHLKRLLEATAGINIAPTSSQDNSNFAHNAAGSDQFYFLDEGASRLVYDLSKRIDYDYDLMLPPMGFAVLHGGEGNEEKPRIPPSILLWDNGNDWDSLRVALCTLRSFGARDSLTNLTIERYATPTKHAFAVLAALNASRAGAAEQAPDPSARIPRTAGGGTPRFSEATEPPEVSVTYLSAFGARLAWNGATKRNRRKSDYRWTVKGFWRQQWYPRENRHKRIWIEEHTSGPAEKPLLESQNVKVLRQPRF